MAASKDASVFIIDGSKTMLEPYKSPQSTFFGMGLTQTQPSTLKAESRLSSAIQAVQVG